MSSLTDEIWIQFLYTLLYITIQSNNLTTLKTHEKVFLTTSIISELWIKCVVLKKWKEVDRTWYYFSFHFISNALSLLWSYLLEIFYNMYVGTYTFLFWFLQWNRVQLVLCVINFSAKQGIIFQIHCTLYNVYFFNRTFNLFL